MYAREQTKRAKVEPVSQGLYDNLAAYDLPYAEAVFDIDYFRHTPAPFYQLCAEMWPGRYTPTLTHRFFKALYDRGKLLRCFTQNIDSLERQAGLPDDMIVVRCMPTAFVTHNHALMVSLCHNWPQAAHGNFDRAHVVAPDEPRTPDGSVNPDSRKSVDVEALKLAIMEGEAGWKRFNAKHGGLCKPAITFFGENLPRRFVECIKSDFPCCRLCLIFGSSLLVQPFASLVRRVNTRCPRMLINRERRGEYLGLDFDTPGTTDGLFLGDCDRGAAALAARLGWSLLGSNVGASEVPKCREAELTKIRLGLCKAATAKQAEHIILVEPTYKEIARAAANKLKISTRSIRRLVLKTSVAGYVVGSPLPMGDCRGHLKNDALVWVCTTPLASQSEQEYHGRID